MTYGGGRGWGGGDNKKNSCGGGGVGGDANGNPRGRIMCARGYGETH